MSTLQAFHNDPELKAAMLREIEWRRAQDMIVQGTYGSGRDENWRGCAPTPTNP